MHISKALASILAVAAMVIAVPHAPAATAAPSAVPWSSVSASMVACGNCLLCNPSTAHKNGEGSVVENAHDRCINLENGSCMDAHPSCGGSSITPFRESVVAKLTRQALDGSERAVLELVESYPDQVEVNSVRGALQVIAECNPDAVIAHIPINSDLLHRLVNH